MCIYCYVTNVQLYLLSEEYANKNEDRGNTDVGSFSRRAMDFFVPQSSFSGDSVTVSASAAPVCISSYAHVKIHKSVRHISDWTHEDTAHSGIAILLLYVYNPQHSFLPVQVCWSKCSV